MTLIGSAPSIIRCTGVHPSHDRSDVTIRNAATIRRHGNSTSCALQRGHHVAVLHLREHPSIGCEVPGAIASSHMTAGQRAPRQQDGHYAAGVRYGTRVARQQFGYYRIILLMATAAECQHPAEHQRPPERSHSITYDAHAGTDRRAHSAHGTGWSLAVAWIFFRRTIRSQARSRICGTSHLNHPCNGIYPSASRWRSQLRPSSHSPPLNTSLFRAAKPSNQPRTDMRPAHRSNSTMNKPTC